MLPLKFSPPREQASLPPKLDNSQERQHQLWFRAFQPFLLRHHALLPAAPHEWFRLPAPSLTGALVAIITTKRPHAPGRRRKGRQDWRGWHEGEGDELNRNWGRWRGQDKRQDSFSAAATDR